MKTMDPVLGTMVKQRAWVVAPSRDGPTLGIPLFNFTGDDGELVETAVTPFDRVGEICPDGSRVMAGVTLLPSLELVLGDALAGSPRCIVDTLAAHIAHKRLLRPDGAHSPGEADPVAGIVPGNTPVAALKVDECHGLVGALVVERLPEGADIVARWIPSEHFVPDRDGFALACEGITHEDLLAGLSGETLTWALEGAATLLQDPLRTIPNQVIGALIVELIAGIPRDYPAERRGRELLQGIATVGQPLSDDDYQIYGGALGTLRQLLKLSAQTRVAGKEAAFEVMATKPTWLALYGSIVETVTKVIELEEGFEPPRITVERAIEQVGMSCTDPFTRTMASVTARRMAGIGHLVSQPWTDVPGEGAIELRFRQLIYLLGNTGWQASRPYDFGVLAIAIGGW